MALTRHPFYLGPLGRLQTVRAPNRGYLVTTDLAVVEHRLLSGLIHTGRPESAPRRYRLDWPYLSDIERTWIGACVLGFIDGPFYWLDPLEVNALPSNVSTRPQAGAFQTNTGTLSLAGAGGSRGFGRVVWTPGPVAGSALQVVVRQPVPPAGNTITGSAYVTRTGGVSTTATVYLDFFDAAGAQLASTVGAAVTLSTTAAFRILASTSAPPAGAVTVRLAVVLAAGQPCSVDGMQVEYGPLSAFTPGQGVARVEFLTYPADIYRPDVTSLTIDMIEVFDSGRSTGGSFSGPGEGGGDVTLTLYDAKGDILVGQSDDVAVRLPLGAGGQVLTVDTVATLGVKWATPAAAGGGVPLTLLDATGDLIVASSADAAARLALGTNGQVLTVDTAAYLGVKWAAAAAAGSGVPLTLLDATGDLIVGSANDAAARLPVGANGQVLTADTATTLGVKWATVAAGGGGGTSLAERGAWLVGTAYAAGDVVTYTSARWYCKTGNTGSAPTRTNVSWIHLGLYGITSETDPGGGMMMWFDLTP